MLTPGSEDSSNAQDRTENATRTRACSRRRTRTRGPSSVSTKEELTGEPIAARGSLVVVGRGRAGSTIEMLAPAPEREWDCSSRRALSGSVGAWHESRALSAGASLPLTRFFDPLVGRGLPERRFKRRLLGQAAPRPGQRVLDLGRGSGTLAITVKAAFPRVEVLGLDRSRHPEAGAPQGAGRRREGPLRRGLLERASLRGRSVRSGSLDAVLSPPDRPRQATDARRGRARTAVSRRASRR
jgi:hypothetical protein